MKLSKQYVVGEHGEWETHLVTEGGDTVAVCRDDEVADFLLHGPSYYVRLDSSSAEEGYELDDTPEEAWVHVRCAEGWAVEEVAYGVPTGLIVNDMGYRVYGGISRVPYPEDPDG